MGKTETATKPGIVAGDVDKTSVRMNDFTLEATKGIENAAQQLVYVTNYGDGTLTILNAVTLRMIATIPVGNRPIGVAVTADGTRVYVANSGDDGTLTILDAVTRQVIDTVPMGNNLGGVDVSADGTRVYVGNSGDDGTLTILDAVTRQVIDTVPMDNHNNPWGVAITADGNRFYVTNYNDGTLTILDAGTHKVIDTVRVGRKPLAVAITADGTPVYVANYGDGTLTILDAGTRKVIDTVAVGKWPIRLRVTDDGTRVYVMNQIEGIFWGHSTLTILDAGTRKVIDTVQMGRCPMGLAVTADGTQVYVANDGDGTLTILDAVTRQVIATVPVGRKPQGVAIGPSIISIPKARITVLEKERDDAITRMTATEKEKIDAETRADAAEKAKADAETQMTVVEQLKAEAEARITALEVEAENRVVGKIGMVGTEEPSKLEISADEKLNAAIETLQKASVRTVTTAMAVATISEVEEIEWQVKATELIKELSQHQETEIVNVMSKIKLEIQTSHSQVNQAVERVRQHVHVKSNPVAIAKITESVWKDSITAMDGVKRIVAWVDVGQATVDAIRAECVAKEAGETVSRLEKEAIIAGIVAKSMLDKEEKKKAVKAAKAAKAVAEKSITEAKKAREALKSVEKMASEEALVLVSNEKLDAAKKHLEQAYIKTWRTAIAVVSMAQTEAAEWALKAENIVNRAERTETPTQTEEQIKGWLVQIKQMVVKVQKRFCTNAEEQASTEEIVDKMAEWIEETMKVLTGTKKIITQVNGFQMKVEAVKAALTAEQAENWAREKETQMIVAKIKADTDVEEKKKASKAAREEATRKAQATEAPEEWQSQLE